MYVLKATFDQKEVRKDRAMNRQKLKVFYRVAYNVIFRSKNYKQIILILEK